MLKTKCILVPKEVGDGLRISVMSRHTENDGITPHPGITPLTFDDWQKELAPPKKLVGSYYKGAVSWQEFEVQYLRFLRDYPQFQLVRELARRAMVRDITLLCIEETPEMCHRRLLAEECKKYESGFDLSIG